MRVEVPRWCYKHHLAVGSSKGASVACPAYRLLFSRWRRITTGACEGSLFAEGVSVGSKRPLFTRWRGRQTWPSLSVRAAQPSGGAAWVRRRPLPLVSHRGARQRHQRFDRVVAVGRKRPRLLRLSGLPVRPQGSTLQRNPPKRSSWRETTVFLGSSLSSEKGGQSSSPRARRSESPRTHEMRVFVSTVWMADVGP